MYTRPQIHPRKVKFGHQTEYLQCIGLPLHVIGIVLLAGYFIDLHTNPISGITLSNRNWYVLDWP